MNNTEELDVLIKVSDEASYLFFSTGSGKYGLPGWKCSSSVPCRVGSSRLGIGRLKSHTNLEPRHCVGWTS